MKSFIMALFLLTNAGGSALGIAVSPTAVHPKLVWSFTGLCVATVIAGIAFWFCFKSYNDTEEEMNLAGREVQQETVQKVAAQADDHESGAAGRSEKST